MSSDYEVKCFFNRGLYLAMQEEQFLNASRKDMNAVFEVCFDNVETDVGRLGFRMYLV